MPQTSTGSYDVRDVIRAICDDGELLELRARWAPNVVTAFASIGGLPIGIVANQPLALAGTLDIPASQKAARFVAFCDAFNLPIVTLVDTPGFYPGKDLEWRGMIRHGAQLVFAYGRATVPRICVILRKSYGGAYIVMDSKTMGNDLCLAWPWAELAVMGAGQAAAILQRRATPEERAAFEVDYAERLLNPYIAADRGYLDGVIEPAETRQVIAEALADPDRQTRSPRLPAPRQHAAVDAAGSISARFARFDLALRAARRWRFPRRAHPTLNRVIDAHAQADGVLPARTGAHETLHRHGVGGKHSIRCSVTGWRRRSARGGCRGGRCDGRSHAFMWKSIHRNDTIPK